MLQISRAPRFASPCQPLDFNIDAHGHWCACPLTPHAISFSRCPVRQNTRLRNAYAKGRSGRLGWHRCRRCLPRLDLSVRRGDATDMHHADRCTRASRLLCAMSFPRCKARHHPLREQARTTLANNIPMDEFRCPTSWGYLAKNSAESAPWEWSLSWNLRRPPPCHVPGSHR